MSHSLSEQSIKALFHQQDTELEDEAFTQSVLSGTGKVKRHQVFRRVLIGVALFVLGVVFEEYIFRLSEFLLLSLVELPDSMAAQVLAPLNSVAGLLAAILLSMRAAQKKLLKR